MIGNVKEEVNMQNNQGFFVTWTIIGGRWIPNKRIILRPLHEEQDLPEEIEEDE